MNESDKANPSTVAEVVNELIEGMSFRDRIIFTNLTEEELEPLQTTLAMYIGIALEKMSVRKDIFQDCIAISKDENLDEANASNIILKEMLRVIK